MAPISNPTLSPAARSAHVLVVDDDPVITAGTARLLSRDGYSTTQANSGEQALRLATQMPPDLILLDVMLPDIDGLEVCRRLKADPRTSRSFVVLCSALRTDGNSVVQGVDAGADGYLSRPIENRELLARVQAYLRHKTTIDALRDSERHWREQFERERQASYDAEILALGQSAAGAPAGECAPAWRRSAQRNRAGGICRVAGRIRVAARPARLSSGSSGLRMWSRLPCATLRNACSSCAPAPAT